MQMPARTRQAATAPTQQLAEFLASVRSESPPEAIVARTEELFLDWFASALAGKVRARSGFSNRSPIGRNAACHGAHLASARRAERARSTRNVGWEFMPTTSNMHRRLGGPGPTLHDSGVQFDDVAVCNRMLASNLLSVES